MPGTFLLPQRAGAVPKQQEGRGLRGCKLQSFPRGKILGSAPAQATLLPACTSRGCWGGEEERDVNRVKRLTGGTAGRARGEQGHPTWVTAEDLPGALAAFPCAKVTGGSIPAGPGGLWGGAHPERGTWWMRGKGGHTKSRASSPKYPLSSNRVPAQPGAELCCLHLLLRG